MKSPVLIVSQLLTIFFIVFIFPKPIFAVDYTLSGSVHDKSGTAISDALISVYSPNTTNDVVPPTTSDQAGNYSFSNIPEGIYDIQVNPPSGSNYSPIIVEDYNLSGNSILNFTFANIGFSQLQGHIYDQDGNPMQNITVIVDPNAKRVQATTDSQGEYSLEIAPGIYSIHIYGTTSNTSPDISSSSIDLTQSRVLDINFPFNRVTVHVQDSNGNPVEDV